MAAQGRRKSSERWITRFGHISTTSSAAPVAHWQSLHQRLRASGLAKHGELVTHLKGDLGMGHGDANAVVATYLVGTAGTSTTSGAPLDQLYAEGKAPLRPLHELLAKISVLGDFEIAPNKTYISLRRKKQFAMVGPGTKDAWRWG